LVDEDFVKRRIDEMNEALVYMEEILRENESSFARDYKSRFTLRHLILIIIESAASIAMHILAEDFDEKVESYGEAFEKLSYHGVISSEIAYEMISLARLRNLIVHRYWLVNDIRIYRESKESGISVIKEFIKEVKDYVRRS